METIGFRHELAAMQGELLCMARKMTAGHGDARDLLQETALRALDNEAKYTPGTNLRGWVFTIMQRIFAGRCRRAAYGVVLLPSVCEAFPAASRAEAGGDAEAACDLGAARRAVAVLPASFRVPFALYVSGFRYREIAERLDLPIGTVKSRISSARKKLQQELPGYG